MLPPAALDAAFAALADPTRRGILARLALGEATVMELAEPFDLSQPAISKHLKVLEAAGLVSRGQDGTRRPARLEVQVLEAAAAWIRDLERRPRRAERSGRDRSPVERVVAHPGLPRPWWRL